MCPHSVNFALCTLPCVGVGPIMVGLQHWKGVGIRRFLLEDGEPSLSIALLDTEAPGSWNRSASIRVVQHNVQARVYIKALGTSSCTCRLHS